MKTVLTFIIVFCVLVLIHEFGHYYFAKRSGVTVHEFAIGMGPKIFSYRKNGTMYTLRIIPIGGYVRLATSEEKVTLPPGKPVAVLLDEQGKVVKINLQQKKYIPNSLPFEVLAADLEDDLTITGYLNGDDSEEVTYQVARDAMMIEEDGTVFQIAPREAQFESAKLWQRALINFAGPMNNFILGIILFIIMIFMQGGVANGDKPILGQVMENQPAAKAGLKVNDKIVAVGNQKIDSYEAFTEKVRESKGKKLAVTVQRKDKTLHLTLKPKVVKQGNETYGQIGVTNKVTIQKVSFFQKIGYGFKTAWAQSFAIFKALGSLVQHFSLNKLGGPVMIFKASETVSNQGLLAIIGFMAMLSMNLGIMNLLPIPGLDGGKLLFNLVEGLRGKPLSKESQFYIDMAGVIFLFVLIILVTWNDIQRAFF